MYYRKALMFLFAAVITVSSGAALAAPAPKSISLNPYGSELDNGAYFTLSKFEAPLNLPSGRPEFAHGFTVPQDYEKGPLIVRLLVESDDTECVFHLRPNYLYHMSDGEVGFSGTNFVGLDASVPFALIDDGVAFVAPAISQETVEVRFEITEFNLPIVPGDGMNFNIFRAASVDDQVDGCEGPLRVGGMVILYALREERGLTTR